MSTHGMVARFDGMAWPFPCEEMSEIGWRLRYGDATLARSDALRAAEIISAYCALVAAPERKRRHVVRNLRKAMEVTP